MNVDRKTKDIAKSRLDLMEICRQLELHVVDGKFPKACYTLEKMAEISCVFGFRI